MQVRGQIVMRDHMPDQHREFFEQLRFVVLSAVDEKGQVWPFLRTGPAGFMTSPKATELIISSEPLPAEPKDLVLTEGAKISVLGIELETKRRNRMNGTITLVDARHLHIAVDQSFGNCPRYIHVREGLAGMTALTGGYTQAKTLSAADVDQIKNCDMLFIASRAPNLTQDPRAGVDVNHRGGRPGFVQVLDDRDLIIPDYDGNNFFNTFGNIMRDPRCGLQFPDLTTGDILTLIGRAEVVSKDPAAPSADGSNRYLKFRTEVVRRANAAFPMRYRLVETSRNPPEPRGSAS